MSNVITPILIRAYNSNKSPTRCNNFLVYYPDVYLQLNMFRALSCPSSGAQLLQWQPLVLPSYRGDSRAVFVVGSARPRTQHDCHYDTKVKPEAATAVIGKVISLQAWRGPEGSRSLRLPDFKTIGT